MHFPFLRTGGSFMGQVLIYNVIKENKKGEQLCIFTVKKVTQRCFT